MAHWTRSRRPTGLYASAKGKSSIDSNALAAAEPAAVLFGSCGGQRGVIFALLDDVVTTGSTVAEKSSR